MLLLLNLLAQLRKLDRIRSHLRDNRDVAWRLLEGLPGLGFRELLDPDGDLATVAAQVLTTEPPPVAADEERHRDGNGDQAKNGKPTHHRSEEDHHEREPDRHGVQIP